MSSSHKYRIGPWMVESETGNQLEEIAAAIGLSRIKTLVVAINALWERHCAKTAKAGKEGK